MKMKTNKLKIGKIVVVLFLITIITSLFTFGYYSNINKFLVQEQNNVYVDGKGQHRLAEDFIVDGCGTGTILDTVTGLCWDKNLNVGAGTKQWATNTAYPEPVWTGSSYTWGSYVATNYPAFKVCDDLTTGGNTDWRMPTRAELLTLIDEIGPAGTTCTTLGGFGFTNCQNSYYWSSNQRGSSTTGAFRVSLGYGRSDVLGKTGNYYVACVRRN